MKNLMLTLAAVAALVVFSTEAHAGLLNRMLGGGGGCCEASCCEATCAAAEPACGCAAAPTCAAEPSCAVEPSCGCAPSDCCGDSCCRPTPVRDFLAGLHCRLHSLCHRDRCCDSGCCEATCAGVEPACGCAH